MSSNLYIKTLGRGPDLVLLHGWSFSHVVWQDVAEALADFYTVHLVDLPGHGRSDLPAGDYTLDSVTAMLAQHLPQMAIYMGWSLGGQIALNLALQQSSMVQKLILVTANAQFVKSDNWPFGMAPEVLAGFGESLEQDCRATLQRFLALQARDSENARETIKVLRERMADEPLPRIEALRGGLDILRDTSLPARLSQIRCPVRLVSSLRDALVPAEAMQLMWEVLPDASLFQFEYAGHAPFLSHPQEFLQVIEPFLGIVHEG
ncbi:MAG: pimeloyl-ACP methyl ester esterase BioH [Gammaproteobacteria bacterium]|nr:pimeloyl-ACP methyl ester esterase BioH [Gammaproteobacteria bacterium]